VFYQAAWEPGHAADTSTRPVDTISPPDKFSCRTPHYTRYRSIPHAGSGPPGEKTLQARRETTTNTDYVIDPNNHTGYAQVIEEWDPDGTQHGQVVRDRPRPRRTVGRRHERRALSASRRAWLDAGPHHRHRRHRRQRRQRRTGVPLRRLREHADQLQLYTGEQFNATTGQYYLRARYYDPPTGRFNRLDPFAGSTSDPVSLHKYLYAGANPVMYSDPSGEFSFFSLLGASAISSYIRANWQNMVVRFAAASAINLVIQIRVRSILAPLAEEADNLARAVGHFSASAAATVSEVAQQIRGRLNTQLGLAGLGVAASTISTPFGLLVATGRLAYVAASIYDLYSEILEGVCYDDGRKFYSLHGQWRLGSLKDMALGQLEPAEDLRKLTRFFEYARQRRPLLALQSFKSFGRCLGQYGQFEGRYGVYGNVNVGFAVAAGKAYARFVTGPDGFTTELVGTGSAAALLP